MTEKWYSIVEYARAFSLSDMTVRRRIKTGKLEAELRDGKYYIREGGAGLVKPDQEIYSRPSGPEEASPHTQLKLHEKADRLLLRASKDLSAENPINFGSSVGELMRLYDSSRRDFKNQEKLIIEKYEEKLKTMELSYQLQEKEIRQLKQNLEDLQLLVDLFESKLTVGLEPKK